MTSSTRLTWAVAATLVVVFVTIPRSDSADIAGVPPAPAPTAPATAAPAALDAEARGRLEARLKELLPRFRFDRDEVRGGGWYEHYRVLEWGGGTHLAAPVTADGEIYLRATYRGDSWVFAERLVARIGERVLESGRISSRSADNQRRVVSGGVTETLHFANVTDGLILATIASDPSQPARIRFEGSERSDDVVLTAADRRGLAEAFELASILRRLR